MLKKSTIALLLAIVIFATGCAPQNASSATSSTSAATSTAATSAEPSAISEIVTTGGDPWINSDIQKNLSKNMQLSPTDDLHLYVNHDWLLNAKIPAGKDSYSSFSETDEAVRERLFALLEDKSQTSHEAKLVQTLYNASLDWDARNAAGLDPIRDTVAHIQGIETLDDLSNFLLDPEASLNVVYSFATMSVDAALDDPGHYIAFVERPPFLLDDAAEYQERTELGNIYYETRLLVAQAILTRLGYTQDQVQAMFDRAIELEGKIAAVSLTSADWLGNIWSTVNNIYTLDEIRTLSPTYPLADFLIVEGGGDAGKYCVTEPKVIETVNRLYTKENLESIKDLMLIWCAIGEAPYLDKEAYEAHAKAMSILTGSEAQTDVRQIALEDVREMLPEQISKVYAERYGNAQLKQEVTDLCHEVIGTYRTMLSEEDWLSSTTRQKAIEKLDNMRIYALYPDVWQDCSALKLEGLSFYDCLVAIDKYEFEHQKLKVNTAVNNDMWCEDLPNGIIETNAIYYLNANTMCILLGFLDEATLKGTLSTEELYASLGCAIAHEISHAFDTSGASYDKNGKLEDWWTKEDYEAFQKRANKLVEYYNGITIWDGQQAIGENIQGEAIADIAGTKAILSMAKKIPNFDYEKFFIAYARLWRTIHTKEGELQSILWNAHPLAYLRTNVTLQQFDEFLETFGVKEGDKMYLAPEDRISVW